MGLTGGIWLFWKDCNQSLFNLVVLNKASRSIACSVTLLNENLSFVIIFVYAPPKNEHKAKFCDEVFAYVNSLLSLFVIIGDFNDMGCAHDKFGGASFNSNRLCNMTNILASISCVELPFLGSRYTWRKKRIGPNNIMERLDKGVASSMWLSLFPQAKLIHHPFTSSDHCQVFVDLTNLRIKKAPPFR